MTDKAVLAMRIYVDADACPVKDEVMRVAERHQIPVSFVANSWMRLPEGVRSLNAWKPDGTLVFSNVGVERIGKRLPVDDGLEAFFDTNEPYGHVIDLREDEDERETANARPGHDRLVDTYVPILGASGRPIGAYEVYTEADRLDAVVARWTRTIWLTVAVVFAVLFVALALLADGASKRLRSQADRLRRNAADLRDSPPLCTRRAAVPRPSSSSEACRAARS